MSEVVIFAVGSPLVVDVEESAVRAGLKIAAGIRNVPGPSHLRGDIPLLTASELTPDLLELPFLVPLFGPGRRQSAGKEAAAVGFKTPHSLLDPTSILPRKLSHGAGCYINAGCVIGAAASFGDFVLINRAASIGHHAVLSDFVSVGPGVVLTGEVWVGRGAVIGAGAVIMPNVRIGENSFVGAGSVVGKDVPPFCAAFGNPARILRKNTGGYAGIAVT